MNNDLISRSELKKSFNKWWGCDDIPTSVVEDLIDNAPTVNDCPSCEYKINYDYLSSSSSYKELQALRKFKKDNERPQGEWIDHSSENLLWGHNECPFCHKRSNRDASYCQYCGADLRGDSNGRLL